MGKRIDIMDLRQLIRLKQTGESNRYIADLLHVSRNTVNSYVRRIKAFDLGYSELLSLEDASLYDLFPKESEIDDYRYRDLAQYFPDYLEDLKRPGCTKQRLWEEYIARHPDGYMSSQFCYHLNNWLSKGKVTGKLEHKYGEKLFIDFTGKRLEVVDRHTGEIQQVEVFVAILPASQRTFVVACRNQGKKEVVRALSETLSYMEGVPKAIVCDNFKTMVTKSHKYAPKINLTFKDMALHYGCVIDPTRVYSPQDKALVEGAVKLVYQRIFYPLSKQTFFSLEDLNEQIRLLLEKYNNYQFSQRDTTRNQEFVDQEKQYLQTLPNEAYTEREFRKVTVQKMGYVYLSEDKHYYSVPYRYIGKKVWICYSHSAVEIYHNKERICFHKRDYRKGKYTTQSTHLSSTHKAYSSWSLSYFQSKALKIGQSTHDYITRLIDERSYPEVGYKQALGIISLSASYSNDRINTACSYAFGIGTHNYHTIESILKNKTDQQPLSNSMLNIPQHENIRGVGYYN